MELSLLQSLTKFDCACPVPPILDFDFQLSVALLKPCVACHELLRYRLLIGLGLIGCWFLIDMRAPVFNLVHRRYTKVPKMHAFMHLLEHMEVTRINPRNLWCFADEDYVGRISRVGQASVRGAGSYGVGRSLIPKYTRGMALLFSLQEQLKDLAGLLYLGGPPLCHV